MSNELPSWFKPDLRLDDSNFVQFVHWKGEAEPYMGLWCHRSSKSDTGWCMGSFAWRNPDPAYFPANITLWDLGQLEPLTVAPSLLCLDCQAHGFIRDGRWIPV